MIRIKPTRQFDVPVLIIGAGPAGSALAAQLASQKIRVLMVDASGFPRDKVCGDFVGPVALRELKALGVTGEQGFRDTQKIDYASLFLEGRKLIEKNFPEQKDLKNHGRVIERVTLDHWIHLAARRSGAEFIPNKRLTGFDRIPGGIKANFADGESIKTELLIGADGSNSTVARQFYGSKNPAKNQIIAIRAYFTGIKGPANRADLYFSEESFPGYTWVFPTGPRTANVGIGMAMETFPEHEMHLKEILRMLIEKDDALKSRLRGAKLTGKVRGWPLSTFNHGAPLIDDNLMLIGDAAGLINSLNGEGIQYALMSSRWAADTIAASNKARNFSRQALYPYEEKLLREMQYDMAMSNMVIQCIRNRSLNPLWMELLKTLTERASIDDAYAATAGGVLAGIHPANAVLGPSFLSKTLLQGMVHFGMSSMSLFLNNGRNLATLKNNVQHNFNTMWNDPKSYWEWIGGMLWQGAELGQNVIAEPINQLGSVTKFVQKQIQE